MLIISQRIKHQCRIKGEKTLFKTLFALLFSTGYAHHSNHKVDKKIAEMRKQGRGIWINGKFIPMG